MGTTLKQIAELAGVSLGTVDRALHDRGRINPQVAQRIKQIAKELNYHPNTVAKSLSIRKRNLKISVIFHIESRNPFFDDIMKGILTSKNEIADFGIAVDIKTCPDFHAEEQLKLINQAIDAGSNAIAIVPINHPCIQKRLNELYEQQFPVIFLTNLIDNTEYLSFVGCNYTLSGAVTAGLLNLINPTNGNLLLFSPNLQMLGHVLRMNGLKDTLKQDYPHIRLQYVIELTGNDINDYQLTKTALETFPNTNLIVCPGAYSHGNLQALEELNYFQNSKVICYDYSSEIEERIKRNQITATIVQQPQLQGSAVIKILFDFLTSGKLPETKNQYIKTQIILKENLPEL